MSSIVIAPGDPAYPPALAPLGSAGRPPPTLWVRGTLPDRPGVAVVGTREASEEACAFTRTLAAALARAGVAVWSGGAIGIDAAAHEGALAAGGVTVLVAGGGLDRPYPPQHRELFAHVVACGGAVVARVADDTPPMAPLFLARNEVLAALTSVTVLVQAGFKSGARNTAAVARRLGRTLCVVPHPPWDERGRGCALELARGALAVTGPEDVLAALDRPPPPPTPSRRKRTGARDGGGSPRVNLPIAPVVPSGQALDEVETSVFAVLGDAPRHQDEVCERAGLTGAAAVGALLTLTLRSVVVEGPAGFFRRASRLR